MRRAVELVVKGFLRSRYGVAALLALAILGILVSTRLTVGAGEPEPPLTDAVVDRPLTTVAPTAGDDGLTSPEPPPRPVTSPGADKPLAVARSFVTAWLRHKGVTAEEWHAALLPHSTEELAGQLADVDPAGVPADRMTGDPELIPHGTTFVRVAVPVDAGRVVLRLISADGRWLVDGVDWERA